MLIGTGKLRSNAAWKQVYRAVDHGRAKKACSNNDILKKFPKPIEDFGNEFVQAQIKRHDADYNPNAIFVRSEVLIDIETAEMVIKGFKNADIQDRRAFVAWLTFSNRQ